SIWFATSLNNSIRSSFVNEDPMVPRDLLRQGAPQLGAAPVVGHALLELADHDHEAGEGRAVDRDAEGQNVARVRDQALPRLVCPGGLEAEADAPWRLPWEPVARCRR